MLCCSYATCGESLAKITRCKPNVDMWNVMFAKSAWSRKLAYIPISKAIAWWLEFFQTTVWCIIWSHLGEIRFQFYMENFQWKFRICFIILRGGKHRLIFSHNMVQLSSSPTNIQNPSSMALWIAVRLREISQTKYIVNLHRATATSPF